MHKLPTNLAPLADIAADQDSRFAFSGISLRVDGRNRFEAAATDGRRLLVITGPCVGDAKDFPAGPIHDAPNGEASAIVPAAAWKKTFAAAAKLTGKRQLMHRPDLRAVAVQIGKNVTSFAATDLDASTFDQPKNLDAKFPPYKQILPDPDKAKATLRVSAPELAELLRAAAHFTPDDTDFVTLEVHKRFLAVRCEANGQRAVGIQSIDTDPLPAKKGEKQPEPELELPPAAAGPADAAEVARLKAVAETWEKRVQAQAEEIERLRQELEAARSGAPVHPRQDPATFGSVNPAHVAERLGFMEYDWHTGRLDTEALFALARELLEEVEWAHEALADADQELGRANDQRERLADERDKALAKNVETINDLQTEVETLTVRVQELEAGGAPAVTRAPAPVKDQKRTDDAARSAAALKAWATRRANKAKATRPARRANKATRRR
jgi:hypothetical protein